ncbi:MAG: class I SAM-dependent methyltransferase [Alphaproteobacteria bacterium]|nr:class I SAM-dependent methyltransferase [Alphaproteobacteria bacterium]
MAQDEKSGQLGAVYGAGSTAEVAGHYDRWAATYDADMSAVGYRHPTISLALLARHLPRGARPVLDAGVGTGIMGEWLGIAGYPEVEGLDISEGMLAVAARRGSYARLHKLALGGPLPFATGAFAGILSVGVFTTGHVGAEGLDELVRICRPGGIIVLTVKTTLLADSMDARLAKLAAEGRIARLETTAPYVSMPGEAGTIPSCGLVLKVV